MNYKNFKSAFVGAHEEKKFLKLLCCLLLVSNGVAMVGWLKKDTSIVLIPPGLSEKTEIATNKASEGYKKAWGAYSAMLLGNVTPENADFVREALAGMVSGEINMLVGEQIAQELEILKTEQVSSTFEMKGVIYEPETDKVFVSGLNRLLGVAGVQGRVEPSDQTFEFIIDVKQFSPIITHMASYASSPRIMSVLQQDEVKRTYEEQLKKTQ
jgi:conjugal transfer pilus assembly protein TraE